MNNYDDEIPFGHVRLSRRLAVAFVILVGALTFMVIMWDDRGCAPESGVYEEEDVSD